MRTHIVTLGALLMMLSGAGAADNSGYHEDVSANARIVGGDYNFPLNFGPSGVTGWFYDREFVVNSVDKGSPAHGILKMSDRIRAVNGRRFQGSGRENFKDDENDPRRVLGMGITESETKEKDGKLVVTVWRDGRETDLTVKLPVMGTYAKNWPYDCEKSRVILHNACKWLVDNQYPEGFFVEDWADGFSLGPALDGLLLLSSGDPEFLESARRLAYSFAENPGADPLKGDKTGTDGWGWSYQAIFLAEYYLRTGDTYILPYLKHLYDIAMASEHQRGSWSHGFMNANYAVGGYINPVGVAYLLGLALMQETGFELDKKDIENCKLFFRRYSYGGRGIHYGDHKSGYPTKPGGSGTGKNDVAMIAFELFGERDTADRFLRGIVDTYRNRDGCHTGPFLPLMWGPIGASRATPEEFRMFMSYWTWFHDLSRRRDGSFLLPSQNGGAGYSARGPVFTMGGQALVYALPQKKTRVCGAKDSPFALAHMPKELKPVKALADQKKWAEAGKCVGELIKGGLSGDGVMARAQLMQESLQTTLTSIAFTLSQIEQNIKDEEIVLARTRVRNLENLMGGAQGRLAELKKGAEGGKCDRVVAAWKLYCENRVQSFVDPHAGKILKNLADDQTAGFVRGKARQAIEENVFWPSYALGYGGEGLYRVYHPKWNANKQDPSALAVMRALAFGDCIIWPAGVSKRFLEQEGLLGEFPFSTALVSTSDHAPVKWKYLTMDEFNPPQGWQEAQFDDLKWEESATPFLALGQREKAEENEKKKFNKKFLIMRTTFDVADTKVDALRMKCQIDEADVYLNGSHVARVLAPIGGDRRGAKGVQSYAGFDISSAGLPALKKGRNVLAVKVTKKNGVVDVGLLSVKR